MTIADKAIKRLNALLSENPLLGGSLDNSNSFSGHPIIFIIGLPRSGTTPLVQLLIQRFKLGYVTNLVAKFWEAPEIGIALAKEISNDPGGVSSQLESYYGFTSGYEGHHEFGYFWQRWFKFKETHYLDPKGQSEVDVNGLKRKLFLMERIWQRPLIFKNAAALPLQTEFLGRIIENSLFIHIERDLIDIAASLLEGRKKYFNDVQKWFSIKPKEYSFLKSCSYFDQVSGQVFYANKEILQQLESIPNHRKHQIKYDRMCDNSEHELSCIKNFFIANHLNIQEREIDLTKLDIRKVSQYNEELISQIKTLIDSLKSGVK